MTAKCVACGVPVELTEGDHDTLLRGELPLLCRNCSGLARVMQSLEEAHGRTGAAAIAAVISVNAGHLAMASRLSRMGVCPTCTAKVRGGAE